MGMAFVGKNHPSYCLLSRSFVLSHWPLHYCIMWNILPILHVGKLRPTEFTAFSSLHSQQMTEPGSKSRSPPLTARDLSTPLLSFWHGRVFKIWKVGPNCSSKKYICHQEMVAMLIHVTNGVHCVCASGLFRKFLASSLLLCLFFFLPSFLRTWTFLRPLILDPTFPDSRAPHTVNCIVGKRFLLQHPSNPHLNRQLGDPQISSSIPASLFH